MTVWWGLAGLLGLLGFCGLLRSHRAEEERPAEDPLARYPVAREPARPNADTAHTPLMTPAVTPEMLAPRPRQASAGPGQGVVASGRPVEPGNPAAVPASPRPGEPRHALAEATPARGEPAQARESGTGALPGQERPAGSRREGAAGSLQPGRQQEAGAPSRVAAPQRTSVPDSGTIAGEIPAPRPGVNPDSPPEVADPQPESSPRQAGSSVPEQEGAPEPEARQERLHRVRNLVGKAKRLLHRR